MDEAADEFSVNLCNMHQQVNTHRSRELINIIHNQRFHISSVSDPSGNAPFDDC